MSRVFDIVPGLAWSDLRNEWILTLCLVIAIAAVVAPLLILMGLKQGTIATLRHRLVENPVYREIRPAETREYPESWFREWRQDPRVGFLMPTILPASSIARLLRPKDHKALTLDLVPSGAGDPLLSENGIAPPAGDSGVLTAVAARHLGIGVGDEVELRVSRIRRGRSEHVSQRLRINGILPERASGLERLYAPLSLVLDVERYKEGMAAARRGWPGETPRPYASFDGVLVLSESELPRLLRNALRIESGLATIEPVEPDGVDRLIGLRLPDGWRGYRLGVPRGTITRSSYLAVKRRLRGHNAVVLPFVEPFELEVDGQRVRVIGRSLGERDAARLGVAPSPWGGFQANRKGDDLLHVIVPRGSTRNTRVHARFDGRKALRFPLRVVAESDRARAVVPLALAAQLHTGRERALSYDESGGLRMRAAGFRGFRLYAKHIDDVPDLANALERQGIAVLAEIEAIRRIQVLDAGLSRLFWLIAVLGFGGGIAVLAASLYAAVERKGRDLAMLRLIGLSRTDLFALPVQEGLLIAAGGMLCAWFAYLALATVINRVFTDELGGGERICELSVGTLLGATAITLGVALLSALIAARKATRIDPADAIRAE